MMKSMDVNPLHPQSFYDDRYRRGYMDAVSPDKAARIGELLGLLPLRAGARVLDFGCGVGVITELLRRALPGCSTWGCDISPAAIALATARYPKLQFFVLGEETAREHAGSFDLIFSHHVLEHVEDIQGAIRTVANLATSPHAFMFHILPCGNLGSYERNICDLYENGIEPSCGNRFFFEDRSHLRRLTSAELSALLQAYGFVEKDAAFANQFWGAINWITDGDPRVPLRLFDITRHDIRRPGRLLANLAPTLSLSLLRAPRRLLSESLRTMRLTLQARDIRLGKATALALLLPLNLLLLVPSTVVDLTVRHLARREWRRVRRDERGSEMLLLFER